MYVSYITLIDNSLCLLMDLAEFQDLYKQITICDSYFLKGNTPAGKNLGNVDFFSLLSSMRHHIWKLFAGRHHVI